MRFRHNAIAKVTSLALATTLSLTGIVPAAAAAAPNTTAVFQPVQLPCQSAVVRYSAHTGSTAVGALQDGTELIVLEEGDNWYAVNCGEMTGYVRAEQVVQSDGVYTISCQGGDETLQWQSVAAGELESAQEAVIQEAMNHLGTPYVWGGKAPGGFDCSGFVYYVYGQMGYSMGYDAVQQLKDGLVVDRSELEPGDLVFFQGTSWQSSIVTHVGIYAGDGEFIHASNSGIAVASLDDEYWQGHYFGARRVLVAGVTLHGIASSGTGVSN